MTDFGPDLTRKAALALAGRRLAEAPVDAGPGDARFLLLHALGLSQTQLLLDGGRPIGDAGASRLSGMIERRLAGEPVARIIGVWEFWGLPFALSPDTLVPRPDTETLVEAALARCPERTRPLRILDLGTGSGCILIALLTECPAAFGVGIDRSHRALVTASANACANAVAERCAFAAASWCDALAGSFDLVVANPPYIATDVIAGLSIEVRCHDPLLALDGGEDGLDAYRGILTAMTRQGILAPGGSLHLEIGYDQAGAVSELAGACGFQEITVRVDLAGNDRVVSLAMARMQSGRVPEVD